MTELLEVYKCEKCGNVVKIAHAGDGELVCRGVTTGKMEELTSLSENSSFFPGWSSTGAPFIGLGQ